MLEAKVERHFVNCATAHGGEVRKLAWLGRNGAPDRLLVLPVGRVFFVELKRPGKDAEAHQAREHERLRAVGADVRVLDTIELVDAFFHEITKGQ
jgi:hypothetical protein